MLVATHAFDIAMRLAHTDTIDIVMVRATDTLDIIMSSAMQTLNVRLRVAGSAIDIATLGAGGAVEIAMLHVTHKPYIAMRVATHTLDIAMLSHSPIRLLFLRRSASIAYAHRDTSIHSVVSAAARSRVVMCTRLSVHTRSRRQASL